MKISVYDTSICDDNLGNQIIMDAIDPVVEQVFESAFVIRLQYLEKFGSMSKRHIRESEYTIFGGTNALSSQMNRYAQMGFTLRDAFQFHNVVLMGVGWWQYQKPPNFYTRTLLKKLLHPQAIHSVRDEYSKRHLEDMGLRNVLNTSCPTVWRLTPEHCATIPSRPSSQVVCTVTDYHQSAEADAAFLRHMLERYDVRYLWIQGAGDLAYFRSLGFSDESFTIIPPKLSAFDALLAQADVDYVGTRLHAGIRALQHRRRSVILAIDNRAMELGGDIGLQVCRREDLDAVKAFAAGREKRRDIQIPMDAIERWKAQFA